MLHTVEELLEEFQQWLNDKAGDENDLSNEDYLKLMDAIIDDCKLSKQAQIESVLREAEEGEPGIEGAEI